MLLDPHSGSAFAKSFFTGLTLFIIDPLFFKQLSAVTDATMSVKWLSLGKVTSLEVETVDKAKKSLFQQLISDIGK